MKIKKFINALSFPVLVLVVHVFLYFFELYEQYSWIDVPMHFFGGLSIAVMFLILTEEPDFSLKLKGFSLFILVVSFVALIAVLWEFFEFGVDMIFLVETQRTLEDTLADLLFGLIGGVFGFFALGKFKY